MTLHTEVEALLGRAPFCHVTVSTPLGPHVTPVVFAYSSGRLWATTARASTKARAWREDRRVAALVEGADDAVSFTGRARTFDVLEPATWPSTLREAPTLALATARFAAKNARFFAGYAVDARSVPFAWMPPGRVLVEISIERWRRWGASPRAARPGGVPSVERFRVPPSSEDPLGALPSDIADAVGRGGRGALALDAPGPVVVPAGWVLRGGGVYGAVRSAMLEGIEGPRVPVALGVDRPTWWRARDMVGAMVQGIGEVVVVDRLTSGRRSASGLVSEIGMDGEDAVLVRIHPTRVVWWRGWSSGSARVRVRGRPRSRAGGGTGS